MKVIVVGCGATGAALANALLEHGHTVAVVDRDAASFGRLCRHFRGRTLEGVGFDRDVLLRAGIEEADALAAVTHDDKVNLLVSQIARQHFHVPRVVARLLEPGWESLYAALGVPVITSVSWEVRRLEQLICHTALSVADALGHGEVLLVDLLVMPALEGYTMEALTQPGSWMPVVVIRREIAQLGGADFAVQAGDVVRLAVSGEALDALQAWLRERNIEVDVCAL